MCIVIDLNKISSVLNPQASDHHEFRPILDWIDKHNTKIVYGGSQYKRELRRARKYFAILSEMKRAGTAQEIDEDNVNRVQEEISQTVQHSSFNDQAIVAIVIVSHCRLICSSDQRSFPFLRLKSLYPKHIKRPSIYTSRRNIALLYHKNILGRCGPCCAGS